MSISVKEFNKNIAYQKFKMETFKSALALIKKHDWMGSIDLYSAYYSCPIEKRDRKYLKFWWKDKLYEYTCLANGVSQGPRCFTKMTKPIYAHLHELGHISTGYLDDSLLISASAEECAQNVRDTICVFDKLGFVVHPTKSVLSPVQVITYLGFIIDSVRMTIALTDKRKEKIKQAATKIKEENYMPIREVASFIGLVVAAFPAVPYGPLHYRTIDQEKTHALKKNGNR